MASTSPNGDAMEVRSSSALAARISSSEKAPSPRTAATSPTREPAGRAPSVSAQTSEVGPKVERDSRVLGRQDEQDVSRAASASSQESAQRSANGPPDMLKSKRERAMERRERLRGAAASRGRVDEGLLFGADEPVVVLGGGGAVASRETSASGPTHSPAPIPLPLLAPPPAPSIFITKKPAPRHTLPVPVASASQPPPLNGAFKRKDSTVVRSQAAKKSAASTRTPPGK